MANPTSREEFKAFCLRSLGHPVIQINVADEQIDDRIDEALSFFYDYHFNGSERIYYKVEVTQQIKDDGYITLPENIIGAVSVFRIPGMYNTASMFNATYQFMLTNIHQLTSGSLAPFVSAMQNIELFQQILVGDARIRHNRHRNRLHIDTNWDRVAVGQFLIIEAHQVIDPAQFTDIWSDRWLQRYATALIKKNWGNILSKYEGVVMVGGIKFDGVRILREATEEVRDLEARIINEYSRPPEHFIG